MDQTLEESLEDAIAAKVGGEVDVTAIYPGMVVYTMADGSSMAVDYQISGGTVSITSDPHDPAQGPGATPADAAPPPDAAATATPTAPAAASAAHAAPPAAPVLAQNRAGAGPEPTLFRLTGRATLAEAEGVIAAWKQSHDTVVQLSGRLAKLEADAQHKERERLVKLGRASGQLTPGNEAKILAKGDDFLRAYLETAPSVVPVNHEHTQAPSGSISMNSVALNVAKLFGHDPKKVTEFKQKRGNAPVARVPAKEDELWRPSLRNATRPSAAPGRCRRSTRLRSKPGSNAGRAALRF
jgi:hypothetical protein